MTVATNLTKEVKNAVESIFINHNQNAFYLLLEKFMSMFAETTECHVYCLVISENYVTPSLHNYFGYSRHVYSRSCELNR